MVYLLQVFLFVGNCDVFIVLSCLNIAYDKTADVQQ